MRSVAAYRGTPGRPLLAALLFLLLPFALGCRGSPDAREGPTLQDRIASAQKAFEEGKFPRVILLAERAYEISDKKDLQVRGEALYLQGEALFHLEEYFEAHELFEKVLDRYPSHGRFRQSVEREYQIGTLLLQGEDPGRFLFFHVGREKEGIRILERIVDEFPAERFAEDSQFLIATYYFDRHEYEEAQEAYTRLIADFPGSKWAAISLYRKGVCIMRRSQGPRYDPTPYEEARRVFRDYLKQHPRGDQVREAEARIDEVDEALAREEYEIARSYLRQGKPVAAAIYLQSILDNYSRTSTAELARETLAGLQLPEPELSPDGGKG